MIATAQAIGSPDRGIFADHVETSHGDVPTAVAVKAAHLYMRLRGQGLNEALNNLIFANPLVNGPAVGIAAPMMYDYLISVNEI